MTTGQLIFYGGAGLLALTIVLAIVFAIKKPKYDPQSAAYTGTGGTVPLRNGYPTDPLTIRRGTTPVQSAPVQPAPVRPTAPVGSGGTVPLSQAGATPGTVPLQQGTMPLQQGTMPLQQGTMPLQQGTMPLQQGTVPLQK